MPYTIDDFEIYKKSLIRKTLNFTIILSPFAGVVFYISDLIDWFALFNFIITAPFLMLVMRLLFRRENTRRQFKSNALKILELSVLIVSPITSFGALYGFKHIYNYDNFVHLITSLALTFIFLIVALAIFNHRINTSFKWRLIAIFLFFFMIWNGFLWEYFQEYSDFYLETKMFTDPAQPIDVDVLYDLTFNGVGTFLAVFVIIIFEKWFKNYLLKNEKS